MGAGINGLHVKSEDGRYFVKRWDHKVDYSVILSSFETIDEAMRYARDVLGSELDEVERTLRSDAVAFAAA